MKKVTISLLAALLAPGLAAAAEPQTRQGFGISFGLGGGKGDIDCNSCGLDGETGLSGYLRLGGYVRPDLFVAFETNGFTTSEDGVDTTGGFYSAALQWYPNVEKGFYVKGNLGIAGVVMEDDEDEVTSGHLGLGLGVGYDFRLGKNFSLTPYLNVMFTSKNELKLNDQSTGVKASFSLAQIGLGFTWH